MDKLKLLGYVFVFILILNVVLFAFTVTNWIVFWSVLGVGILLVYVVIPRMKKR